MVFDGLLEDVANNIADSSLYTGGGHYMSDYHTPVSFKRGRLSLSQHISDTQKSNELREG